MRSPNLTAVTALLEPLEAYDLSLWLGSETATAQTLSISQSTVSRRCTHLQQALDLPSIREARIRSDSLPAQQLTLVRRLRRINQQLRILEHQQLRFQCDHLLSRNHCETLRQKGWILGPHLRWTADYVVQLLFEGVVDIWLPEHTNKLLSRRQLRIEDRQQTFEPSQS